MKSCKLSDITRVFQFTPLREGRRGNGCQHGADRRISIHAPPRGATPPSHPPNGRSVISIHAPPRGATVACPLEAVFVAIISIHAPPRGATRQKHAGRHAAPISIHAPPRGATPKLPPSPPPMRFQFTPLREGRHEIIYGMRQNVFISIHAPPRGATRAPARQAACTLFQFTPLREGRPRRHGTPRLTRADFNSRPSARGDNPDTTTGRDNHISIHAPPRGATVSTGPKNITYQFQFTPLREGRRTSRTTGCKRHSFQFTPLREGRRGVSVHHGADGKISIHAPPRGATRTSSPL